jgi:hypothetical protein
MDLEAELKRRVQALYEIALDLLSEEEARDLFCSVTKRARGKRGPGRSPMRSPSQEAERKRRKREVELHFEIVRPLTAADLLRMDEFYLGRMNGIGDKK